MNARTDRRCLMKGNLEHNEKGLLFSPANLRMKGDDICHLLNECLNGRKMSDGNLEHNENRLLFSPANCASKRDIWNGTIVPYRYCSKNDLMHALSVQF